MHNIDTWDTVAARVAAGEPVVVVEESPDYPGRLLFQVLDQTPFVRTYAEYLSRFSVLLELFVLEAFLARLAADGWRVCFLDTAAPILAAHDRHAVPLTVLGLAQPLFPFQQFCLRQALERALDQRGHKSGYFFNWAPGTGKGNAAAAGAQELIRRGTVELVLLFTIRKMKINMARRVTALTPLRAEVIDGTPERRRRRYASGEIDCYVMNYEKAHFDLDALSALVAKRRVLFVLDEVQKVLFGENGSPTRARVGLQKLFLASRRAIVWPMSGSVVKHSPLRYHDVFRVQEMRGHNPLGSKESFLETYAREVKWEPGYGESLVQVITWNPARLAEVPHLVSDMTQAVRKTTPGVREYFQDMSTVVVPVQMSSEDRRVYEAIVADARRDPDRLPQYYRLLRHVCNTPAALARSSSELAPHYLSRFPDLITSANCAKLEVTVELLTEIAEAGDKAAVFCSVTHTGLFLIAEELAHRGIGHVLHHGGEMSDRAAQMTQDRFAADESITVFLSSDAGAYGLNLQVARYVINYDCPYDPDLLTQRNDRIDRADSHLSGLTSYVLITEDTVEERIWRIQEQRRRLSATVQGTQENLSRLDATTYRELSETRALPELVFGRASSLTAR